MVLENFEKQQFIKMEYKYIFDWYITYDFSWKNRLFLWKSTICLSVIILNKFVESALQLNIWEIAQINDNDSDAYIEIKKTDKLWHYIFNYQIWWSHEDNYCKMILETDHISMSSFLTSLRLKLSN